MDYRTAPINEIRPSTRELSDRRSGWDADPWTSTAQPKNAVPLWIRLCGADVAYGLFDASGSGSEYFWDMSEARCYGGITHPLLARST